MDNPAPQPRAASFVEWLGPILILPLVAGLAYGLVLWLTRPFPLFPNPVSTATPPQTLSVPLPTPVTSPFTAVNRWFHQDLLIVTPMPTNQTLAQDAGLSRANPLPRGTAVSLAYWDIRILDDPIIRGNTAWQILQETNSFNEPPSDGYEYILIPLWIYHRRSMLEKGSLNLAVTGNENVIYHSYDVSIVPPEPMLNTYLPGNSSSEGWEVFRIRQGEQNLQLIVTDFSEYEEGNRYIALAGESEITIPTETLTGIQRTGIGSSAAEPAIVGQTTTGTDWQITLVDLVRGEAAWQILYETNKFNDPPADGYEYLLAQLRVRYIGLEEGPVAMNRYYFHVVGDDGTVYELPSIVHPKPELWFNLFPGGEVTGWMAMQVRPTDQQPLLHFQINMYDTDDPQARYFLLVGNGR
ncbi:MAG: hypothetical protein H6660_09995 [Ardenticatenaceae bacterium]|nr:hypothetical protein [Ardenticatenaceae bacterium]